MRTVNISGSNLKNAAVKTIIYLFLIVYSLGCLFPFAWSLLSSFKSNDEILVRPFHLPRVLKTANYPQAWVGASLGRFFINTVIYVVAATGILLIITPMAAYIIARVIPSLLLYTYFTLGIMIPIHTTLLPSFILIRSFHLVNTRISIILVYIAFNISISIFILVGFMKAFPQEMEEAAFIDGCSRGRAFFSIIYPLSKPGLATVGILAFLQNWNAYLTPLVLITDKKLKVIIQGVQDLRDFYSQDYGLVTAGAVISFLPVVILYILCQEHVIAGLTAGAVKG